MPQSPRHRSHQALELDFYVPSAIWGHPATEALISRIYSLVEGVTLLGGAKGAWKGEVENTTIVKVMIRRVDLRSGDAVAGIQDAVDDMMRTLAGSTETRQESFMFTVREVTLHETTFQK